MERFRKITRQFNWRFLLVRILVYAVVLAIVTILPSIWIQPPYVLNFLILAIGLGILNAILRPIIQFLTLPFVFATYGLILVIANAIILYALAIFFSERFHVDGLLWAFVGGTVMGILSSFFESLFGLTVPILPESEEALRKRVQQQTPGFSRFILPSAEAEEQEEREAIAAMTSGRAQSNAEPPVKPLPMPADTLPNTIEPDAEGEAQS